LGENTLWEFLTSRFFGLLTIDRIKSLPILGRLEGQALNRDPKYYLRDWSSDREKMGIPA
jgi:hypothetical protein